MPVGNSLNAIGTGFQVSDGLGTWSGRTIVGIGAVTTANQDGVSGNCQISVTPGATAFEVVTTTTKAAVVNTSYVADNASGVNFTLPATASAGSIIEIIYKQGAWVVTPASGQQILFGTLAGTLTTGVLTSKNVGDCIRLRCTVANTTWTVTGCQGQINLS